MIYIDGSPIQLEQEAALEVGQKIKVALIDKTGEDDWDPNDFKVIEFIKQSFSY